MHRRNCGLGYKTDNGIHPNVRHRICSGSYVTTYNGHAMQTYDSSYSMLQQWQEQPYSVDICRAAAHTFTLIVMESAMVNGPE